MRAGSGRPKHDDPRTRSHKIRPRRITPLQQGHLDGLCSVYATINAIRCLNPKLDRTDHQGLFLLLLETLAEENYELGDIAVFGTEMDTLSLLVLTAVRFLGDHKGVELEVLRPARRKRSFRLRDVWASLRRETERGHVAIVGLSGFHMHWTVVTAVSDRTLRLFDSDGLVFLRKRDCGVGDRARHQLRPDDILVLRRRETSGGGEFDGSGNVWGL